MLKSISKFIYISELLIELDLNIYQCIVINEFCIKR